MPAANMDSTATTRLHIDELILDYLLHNCTYSLLRERRLRLSDQSGRDWTEASKAADNSIRLVNSFTQTFARLHPNVTPPDTLQLRVRVCRFVTILLRRLDAIAPSFLPSSRSRSESKSDERARTWLSRRARTQRGIVTTTTAAAAAAFASAPFAKQHIERNLRELRRQMGFERAPAQQLCRGSVSLQEAVAEFMVLSAWMATFNDEASRMWMETATNFMIQSALEAYRCLGAEGVTALEECFAWGMLEDGDEDGDEDWSVVNDMFAGDAGNVGILFEDVRGCALAQVVPPEGTDLESHLDGLAEKHTWAMFEEELVSGYLTVVVSAQPSPVLLQLENGKLAGFDDKDISNLLASTGALVR